jgi:hypothetical protein
MGKLTELVEQTLTEATDYLKEEGVKDLIKKLDKVVHKFKKKGKISSKNRGDDTIWDIKFPEGKTSILKVTFRTRKKDGETAISIKGYYQDSWGSTARGKEYHINKVINDKTLLKELLTQAEEDIKVRLAQIENHFKQMEEERKETDELVADLKKQGFTDKEMEIDYDRQVVWIKKNGNESSVSVGEKDKVFIVRVETKDLYEFLTSDNVVEGER